MKNAAASKQKIICTALAAVLLLAVLVAVPYFLHLRKGPLGHEGVFASMFSIEGFGEKVFTENLGVDTLLLKDEAPGSFEALSSLLKSLEGRGAKRLFLGLDPALLTGHETETADLVKKLSFEAVTVLFPARSSAYWLSMEEGRREEILASYETLAEALTAVEDLPLYFYGDQLWLLGNPACFSDPAGTVLTGAVADKMVLYTFCDGEYLVGAGEMAAHTAALREALQTLSESPLLTDLPDLSGKNVLFLGDSIFGLYSAPTSVPAVYASLSGASVYNWGIGGLCASSEAGDFSLRRLMDALLGDSDALSFFTGGYVQSENLENFLSVSELMNAGGPDLCFVEYGLNDYQFGLPADSFRDGLDDAVERLLEKCPSCRICLVVPGHVTASFLEGGEAVFSERGDVLDAYRDAVRDLAEEKGFGLLDLSALSSFPKERAAELLLRDGIHFNESGRFLLAAEMLQGN